ncbi:MAG: tail fiber protein [Ramlibacter sp.]|nr:tail fiber protein [Ramlibacter sp.]
MPPFPRPVGLNARPSRLPVGSVITFAGTPGAGQTPFVTPLEAWGWMHCDGRALEAQQYPELFAVLGYTYGGSGSQFNIPALPDVQLGAARLPYIICFSDSLG